MSRKLFVGNLPYSVTSERLQEAFSQFGTVTSSKVIVDRETGRSRGFAFLEMETDDQGAAAMQAMNGSLLDGRSIAGKTPQDINRLRVTCGFIHLCLQGDFALRDFGGVTALQTGNLPFLRGR